MLKHVLASLMICSIVFAGCKNAVDPDNASDIAGTYRMTVYNTQSATNNNPAAGNNMVVSKIDKNTVKIVIDYANSSANDVVLDKVAITKNGSVYNLSESFSNATASGNVNGTTLTFDLNYTNGNYAHIVAVK